MSQGSATNRHLGVSPVGATMRTGFSLDLPLDTVGAFLKDARKTTKRGLKAIDGFEGISKDEVLSILFGSKKDTGRKGSDKNSRTIDFSLKNVKKVGIAHPKQTEQKVDYWRVGWDGVNSDTSFKFYKGQTLEFQMTIGGIAATFFNGEDCYTVRSLVNIPNADTVFCEELADTCTAVDCRSHTISLVKSLNEYLLPGGEVLSKYFDIYPIFSTPTPNGSPVTKYKFELEYCGFGGDYELSKVSAQYPGLDIKQNTLTGKFEAVKNANVAPVAYSVRKADILKGCEDCPAGYDEITAGVVYGIALEDDGADLTANIKLLPGSVANSVVKTGQDFGVGHYIVVLNDELTGAEETTFITDNPTAIVKYLGTKQAFCTDDTVETHAWVAAGTIEYSKVTYRIVVADDCNGSRLADVQAAYPDLTITQVGTTTNCVSVFQAVVEIEASEFEGCDPDIVQQIFASKAPHRFDVNSYWYPYAAPVVENLNISCGIEIKAKPIIMNPGECVLDELPFVATSAKIKSLSGGYPVDFSMNGLQPKGSWRVLQLERNQDLDNLGGHFRDYEQKGRYFFRNELPYRNAVSRHLTGSETRLDGLTQYSDVFIEVNTSHKTGMFDTSNDFVTYHILVPYGRTTAIESLFRDIAGAAGLDFQVK